MPDVKGSPAVACRVERGLQALPGVESVTASSLTGSVVVLHDPSLTEPGEILAAIRALSSLPEGVVSCPMPAAPQPVGSLVAASLARLALEAALQQAFTAFLLPPC